MAKFTANTLPDADRFFVDAFGQRYDAEFHPGVAEWAGTTSRELPIPGDHHLSEGIEYVAGALALHDARGNDEFVAVEVGAGWGPWSAFFALVGRRMAFRKVKLAAFEADAARFSLARRHLAQNEVVGADADDIGSTESLEWRLYCAAAWHASTTMLWPAETNPLVAGLRAEELGHDTGREYRGNEAKFVEIRAVDIRESLAPLGLVDIMHIDLQGGERPLFRHIAEYLDTRVKRMMLGTHSR